ncbi:YfgM family protein [Buchnera aphidicola]|uniref:YfgM family protein n=1 Tax=Buchnera aphidicola TaxID=9 RepID=UPI00346476A4
MFKIFKKKIVIFVIFFIVLSSLLLYFFWKNSFTTNTNNLNAFKYEEIIQEINKNTLKNLNSAENFIIKNQNTYGTFTAMILAKKYILKDNFERAIIQLNNSLKYTKEENLKNILKIRIAKIKIQKKEYTQALDILQTIKNQNWSNIIENLKGDIFFEKNDKKMALKHWKKSFFLENSNASKEIINMKINELK